MARSRVLIAVTASLVASICAACRSAPVTSTSDAPSSVLPCDEPIASSVDAELPGEGPLTIGSVELPTGEVVADVIWVTSDFVSDPVQTWVDLVAEYPESGLWPVIIDGLPTELDFVGSAADMRGLDDAENASSTASAALERSAREWQTDLTPYNEFPGLADPEYDCDADLISLIDRSEPFPGYTDSVLIGVVPVRRPSQIVASTGWHGAVNSTLSEVEVSAVLRSWEERYGGALVGLGFADLTVAFTRPPTDTEVRSQLAAEVAIFNTPASSGPDSDQTAIERYAGEISDGVLWLSWD
jgi:hypothetical protein